MRTGGGAVRRDLQANPRSLQSRMEQTESAERCQAVRAKVLLFCYRLTPPEINTHLSSTGKQAAADVYNMKLQTCVYLCMCVSSTILQKSSIIVLHITVNFLMTKQVNTEVEILHFQFMAAVWQTLLVFFLLFPS